MSVLGLDSGYTVKYTPRPSGTPSGKGVYLTVYPLSRPNTDTVYKGYMSQRTLPLSLSPICLVAN